MTPVGPRDGLDGAWSHDYNPSSQYRRHHEHDIPSNGVCVPNLYNSSKPHITGKEGAIPEIHHLLTGFHFGTDQGIFALSTIVLLKGHHNILVDTGSKGRADLLRRSLANVHVDEEAIDMVILTHAHWDHSQNIDMFPNAKILMHPRELEYATSPKKGDLSTARYFLATLQSRDVEEIVEGAEIDPGISILETPGHTRGHLSVLAETPQGLVAVSGDALPWAASVTTRQPRSIYWDETDAAHSIRKLLDTCRIFYPGHDRPFRLGRRDALQYIGGADTVRLLLGHDGVGDVTIKVAPETYTVSRVID